MNQQDKSFLTTFVGLITMLVLLAAAIFLISRGISVVSSVATDDGSRRAMTATERLAPVGRVAVAEPAPEGEAPAVALTGEQVYANVCAACHQAGVLNAPKIGSEEDWAPRLNDKGLEMLVMNAVNGINAMPAKGGNPNLTEQNIHDSVVYMLAESGLEAGGEAVAATEEAAPAAEETQVAEAAPAAAGLDLSGADMAKGEQVYNSACFVCHAQGVAGAPKLEQAAWESRVSKGMETLVSHAINGFNAMPPKGGNMSLSDEDVSHAVAYMVAQSGFGSSEAAPATAAAPAVEEAPAAEVPAAEDTAGTVAEGETREEPLTAPAVIPPAAGQEPVTTTPAQGSEPPAQEPPAADGGVEMVIPEDTDAQAPAPSPEQTEVAAAALQAGEAPAAEATETPAAESAGTGAEPTVDQEAQGRVEAPAPMPELSQEQGEALEQAVEEPAAPQTEQQEVVQPAPAPSLQSEELIPGTETAPQGMVKGVPATQEPQAPEVMAMAAPVAVPSDVDLERGKQLYNTACVICHAQGVAGAPMLTDAENWTPRLGQGFDTLVSHAINGYKAMPPKGGRMDVPDEDIRAAVGYMVENVE